MSGRVPTRLETTPQGLLLLLLSHTYTHLQQVALAASVWSHEPDQVRARGYVEGAPRGAKRLEGLDLDAADVPVVLSRFAGHDGCVKEVSGRDANKNR